MSVNVGASTFKLTIDGETYTAFNAQIDGMQYTFDNDSGKLLKGTAPDGTVVGGNTSEGGNKPGSGGGLGGGGGAGGGGSKPSGGGGGGGIPTKPVVVTTPEEHINLHKDSVDIDVWGAAASTLKDTDANAKVIISPASSVRVSGTTAVDHKDVSSFAKPITIVMPIGGDVLKETKDKSKLTMALVTTDAKGNTTVEYVGGYYNSKEDTFTAYAVKPGDYILVEKSDIMKMDLFIDNRATIINNNTVMTDVAPTIMNSRTMVPVRFVLENMGCQVEWLEAERKVVITLPEGGVLTMTIDQMIPGFGAAPVIENGRTMIPIAYIAYAKGANVMWIEEERRVVIVD